MTFQNLKIHLTFNTVSSLVVENMLHRGRAFYSPKSIIFCKYGILRLIVNSIGAVTRAIINSENCDLVSGPFSSFKFEHKTTNDTM
jgi:hypothetical protein